MTELYISDVWQCRKYTEGVRLDQLVRDECRIDARSLSRFFLNFHCCAFGWSDSWGPGWRALAGRVLLCVVLLLVVVLRFNDFQLVDNDCTQRPVLEQEEWNSWLYSFTLSGLIFFHSEGFMNFFGASSSATFLSSRWVGQ